MINNELSPNELLREMLNTKDFLIVQILRPIYKGNPLIIFDKNLIPVPIYKGNPFINSDKN